MLRMGLGLVAVLVPLQIGFGHRTGDYVHAPKPAKFAGHLGEPGDARGPNRGTGHATFARSVRERARRFLASVSPTHAQG